MAIKHALWLLATMVVAGFGLSVNGQQPVKGPVFPPINPAVARLDQTIGGLDGPGFAIAYGEDMDLLVAACDTGTIQGWKKDVLLGIRNGTGSANKLRGHEGPVLSLAWNGGKVLASVGADKKILFWSPLEGVISKTITSEHPINAIAMDPDGKLLAGGGEDYFVHLWDIEAAKPKGKLAEHAEWILAVTFSPDGKQLASGDFKGKVLLWDVTEGKKIRELTPRPMPPPKVPPDPVRASALAFAPDGKTIAIGAGDGVVHLVSVGDGKLVRSMPGHSSAVTGLAFHPGGTLLVSSSRDRTLRLWNPQNGAAVKTLEGHEAWVEGVVFTNRGTRLASVSADQTVRLWDLTDPPKK
ncbi:MAG: WD40 repeat domain-containing protein [Planctomycetes bacterium]|nr:WD40 repeat domain-containing protein [Planctomycetota bacterium]